MKIILLSGGSGKRLWPLSNETRSKQFLRLLPSPDGSTESMIQRVVRQTRAMLTNDIVVTTVNNQKDTVGNQLGADIAVVTEPERRGTLAPILLACAWLGEHNTPDNEPVVVLPCDTFADDEYFCSIRNIAEALSRGEADMVLMGVEPTYPSAKYGYILPDRTSPLSDGLMRVSRFTEKPDVSEAERLISAGALWNGGVFAFRQGYMRSIIDRHFPGADFRYLHDHYRDIPKESFDRGVVEKVRSLGVMPYCGYWKDLGTWSTFTDEIGHNAYGNVYLEGNTGTYVINELEMPLVCLGCTDMIVAASPDGIIVSSRGKSEELKNIVHHLGRRPMYEERRWGEYKVIDNVEFDDGFCALTKQLKLHPGCAISYQRHAHRDEVWTFIDGEGEIVLDGERRRVGRGDVINIPAGQLHALRAVTSLTFIEVQSGAPLIESDITRYPFTW